MTAGALVFHNTETFSNLVGKMTKPII